MVSVVLYQEALIASLQIQPVSVRKEARVRVFITSPSMAYTNFTVKAMLERLALMMDVFFECRVWMAIVYLNLVILARTAIVASVCKVSVLTTIAGNNLVVPVWTEFLVKPNDLRREHHLSWLKNSWLSYLLHSCRRKLLFIWQRLPVWLMYS